MSIIAARVDTPNGAKYVRQLCKHWSHKLEVEIDGDTGRVRFPSALAIMAADAQGIQLSIEGEDRDDLRRLTGVVANHIDRFAFREAPLSYDWIWQDNA